MRGGNEIQNQKMESKAEIRASIKSAAYLENKKDTRGIRQVVWVEAPRERDFESGVFG